MVHDELKRYFDERGITQQQVADALGVSLQYVNQLLNGRKTLGKKNAERLANLYGLSKPFLLTGEGELLLSSSTPTPQATTDTSNMVPALLAAKDEIIESLKRELQTKDELIASLRRELAHRPYSRNIDDSPTLASEPELK
jgi:transcriptional regulator with XRE-family HTH domain